MLQVIKEAVRVLGHQRSFYYTTYEKDISVHFAHSDDSV